MKWRAVSAAGKVCVRFASSGGILPILFGTIVAAFNREAV
jgi:hypothetical protein